MTTSKKLWFGFGTLTALLVVVCAATIARLQSVERRILTQADVSRPRSTVTRELEIGVMRFALTLHTFVEFRDPRQRQRAAENIADVEKQLAEYRRLVNTEQQRAMDERLTSLWNEYRDLGTKLLGLPERRPTMQELTRLRALRPQIEELLEQQMHPDAVAAFDARKEEVVGGLREAGGFALALLSLGVVVAVFTSWTVGRGIVSAERRATAESERMRLAMEATKMGIWQIDYRTQKLNCSERSREIFGFPRDGELMREMLYERIHPEDRDLVGRAAADAMKPDGTGRFWVEHRVVDPSGEVRWVAAHGRAELAGANGNPEPAIHTGVIIDVTERKRAEMELRESEARFRRLADTMPQIVYVTDATGRIEFINRQWIDFTGQASAESADLEPVILPDDLALVREKWQSAVESGTTMVAEFRLRRAADGEYRWFLTRALPIRNAAGRIVQWYGTSTDIHRQKQIQEALETSDERYRAFIANSTEGIWRLEFDPPIDISLSVDEQVELAYRNGRYAEGNEVMARMYGLDCTEDLLDKTLDFMLPASDPGAREYIASIIRAGYRATDVDSEERDAAGNTVHFANSMVGVVEHGFLKRVWGTQRDVTERKRAEAALMEADRRKDEFLATLAHELRNPLAPLRNGLQILSHQGSNPKAAEQARAMMQRQLGQMVRLIDDLLDVSRISRGKIELQRKLVDLTAVIQTAVETSRPLIESGGHRLCVKPPSVPLVVDADQTRLSQVFANLLNNAAKFTPRGGSIGLTVECEGDEAVVAVSDSGEGIPPEMLSRVFELFTQVDHRLERPHGGLGIGLTLVKKLVEMHGGRVEASSEGPGLGSTFFVRLPIASNASPEVDSAADEGMPNGRDAQQRILIADDNTDAAESLAEVLAMMGNEVRTACDGLEAVAHAATFRPHIVLLDIGMPNLNGYDACRRLREQPWGAELTIVAITGWGQEEDRRRSREAGFDRHLVKPIAARHLVKVLDELLSEKERTAV